MTNPEQRDLSLDFYRVQMMSRPVPLPLRGIVQ